MDLKCKTNDCTFGLGLKQLGETRNFFLRSNTTEDIIDNLPYFDDLKLAIIFSPNSFETLILNLYI